MNFYELHNHINELVKNKLSNSKKTNADALGLDERAGYSVFVDTDEQFIAVHKSNRRNLDYYGGFEYVDKHNVFELGDYVFFLHDSRVIEALDYFNMNL